MSGNGYKVLGFIVWKGAAWYLRNRYSRRRRVGASVLAAGLVAAAGAAVLAQRRNGHAH